MQSTSRQHPAQPFNHGPNMHEELQGVPLCCCGWGKSCKEILKRIECLPDGSKFDLWKQSYAQIGTGSTTKKKKFEEMI